MIPLGFDLNSTLTDKRTTATMVSIKTDESECCGISKSTRRFFLFVCLIPKFKFLQNYYASHMKRRKCRRREERIFL